MPFYQFVMHWLNYVAVVYPEYFGALTLLHLHNWKEPIGLSNDENHIKYLVYRL